MSSGQDETHSGRQCYWSSMKKMQISFGREYNIESSRAMSSHISYLSFFHTSQFEAKKFYTCAKIREENVVQSFTLG